MNHPKESPNVSSVETSCDDTESSNTSLIQAFQKHYSPAPMSPFEQAKFDWVLRDKREKRSRPSSLLSGQLLGIPARLIAGLSVGMATAVALLWMLPNAPQLEPSAIPVAHETSQESPLDPTPDLLDMTSDEESIVASHLDDGISALWSTLLSDSDATEAETTTDEDAITVAMTEDWLESDSSDEWMPDDLQMLETVWN